MLSNLMNISIDPKLNADSTVYVYHCNFMYNKLCLYFYQINLQNRPATDHTLNSTEGWYLLADGAPGKWRDVTSLMSPNISLSSAQCALDFWIYMSTFSPTLKVYTGSAGKFKEVWDSYNNLKHSRQFYLLSKVFFFFHLFI